jgi:hypothetical protein
MADATVDILLKLSSDVSGIRRASSALDGFVNQFKAGFNLNLGGNLASFIVQLPLKILAIGKAAVESADQIKDLSDNLEISVEGYQTLSDLVRRTGGDVGALNTALGRQRASLADAWREGGKARDAYQTLGLSMAKMRQLAPERQFEAIARSVSTATDREEAFAAAGDILGDKAIPKLRAALQTLATDGYDKVASSAQGANRFLTPTSVARLEQLKQSLTDIKDQVVAKAGNDLAGLLGFLGQTVEAPDTPPPKTGKEIEAERLREYYLRQSALATFTLTNAQQALAEVEADSTKTELQKRPQIVAILRAQADEIDRIRQGKFQDVIGLSDDTVPTDDELKRLAEANRMQAEANRLREQANLLQTGGPSAFTRSIEAAQGVEDPSVNRGRLGVGEGIGAGLANTVTQFGSTGEQVAQMIQSTAGAAVNSVGDGIYNWVTGVQSFGDAAKGIWTSFAQSAVRAFTQMLAEYAIKKAAMFALDAAFAAKSLALSVASAAKSLVAWIPSAIAASISSYGVAAAIGLAAVIAGIAAFGGFADGGFTPEGGKHQVAGVVHAGEWVAPQWMVRSPTFGATIAGLEGARRGYADGGMVGGGGVAGAAGGKPVQIVMVDSRREANRIAKNSDAQTQIIDLVREHRYEIFGT